MVISGRIRLSSWWKMNLYSVHSLLSGIKYSKISNGCAIAFGHRKGKTEILDVPSSKIYIVLI